MYTLLPPHLLPCYIGNDTDSYYCFYLYVQMNGDLSAFKRPYTGFIKRCDELERILRFIEAEMKAQGIKPQVSAIATESIE